MFLFNAAQASPRQTDRQVIDTWIQERKANTNTILTATSLRDLANQKIQRGEWQIKEGQLTETSTNNGAKHDSPGDELLANLTAYTAEHYRSKGTTVAESGTQSISRAQSLKEQYLNEYLAGKRGLNSILAYIVPYYNGAGKLGPTVDEKTTALQNDQTVAKIKEILTGTADIKTKGNHILFIITNGRLGEKPKEETAEAPATTETRTETLTIPVTNLSKATDSEVRELIAQLEQAGATNVGQKDHSNITLTI
ncbi:hypothetical protein HY570_02835, partial [Candidatus Micrarchaeota archaeon]|nr:hypothetical protein [Candidatus Micrarchaeota archaeon]